MSKHTPEPWTVTDFGVSGRTASGNALVADCYNPVIPTSEMKANARLIAAAPELLEFAEQIFSGLDTGMLRFETPADETLENILGRGRKAFAKAKGHGTYRSPSLLGGAL